MKIKNIIKISLTLLAGILLFIIISSHNKVLATTFGVNVEFDGKKIEMYSETPEMEWNINNIFPGESAETTLVINSTGKNEVKVEAKPEIVEGTELKESLNIKILNNRTNQMVYDGKYTDFEKINTQIQAKKSDSYTITVAFPTEIENEIQSKNCKIKLKLTAKGEKKELNAKNSINTATQQDTNVIEEITTEAINPIKKQEPKLIFFVLAIMILIFIILVIMFFKTR